MYLQKDAQYAQTRIIVVVVYDNRFGKTRAREYPIWYEERDKYYKERNIKGR